MPRRDETFIVYYREDYTEYLNDNPGNLVCLSESTIQLCLSALRFAGWPTRWRIDREDNNKRVDGAVWEEVKQWQNLAIEELLMSCNFPDINPGLEAIAQSLLALAQSNQQNTDLIRIMANNSVCCEQAIVNQGGGVVHTITTPGNQNTPVYGTQPGLEITPGQFPDGFDSLEEYETDKCQMSNLIFDGWIISLRNLGAIGVFNGVALAGLIIAALAGAIVFPPALIPIMAAAIGILSVEVTILAVVANELEENRSYWVCLIYNSDSVDEIVSVIADALDALIATLSVSGPVGVAIKTICLLLLNSDTLNGLMQKQAHLDYPGADCTDCVDPCAVTNITFAIGTVTADDENDESRTVTVESALIGAGYHVINAIAPSGCKFNISSYNTTGWVGQSVQPSFICGETGHEYGYVIGANSVLTRLCTDTISPTDEITEFALDSLTAFSLTITMTAGGAI